MKLKEIYQQLFESLTDDVKIIASTIYKLIDHYERTGVPPCEINTGECMNFADNLDVELSRIGLKGHDILSDAFFYDPFGDLDPDELYDPKDYGSTPTYDYKKYGMPGHYWIVYNNRHYDSESPIGVDNFFELETFKRWKKKYAK